MENKLYCLPCPICGSGIEITVDPVDMDLKIRAENVPPLQKEKEMVISAYKKAKGFGKDWETQHKARALIYANDLLDALKDEPQRAKVACELLEWVTRGKNEQWALNDVIERISEFMAWRKRQETKILCNVCSEPTNSNDYFCERHSWVEIDTNGHR